MKSVKVTAALVFTVLTALVVPQWALATEFLPFEGKNTVREGEGGTKKVVNGIDFWADGEPPRKYRLLGFINDRRHKTGLIGMASMSSLETDIAATAKQAGGDAVILLASEAETVGMVGTGFNNGQVRGFGNTRSFNSWGTSAAAAVQKQNSRFAVIKYLPGDANRSQPGDGSADVAPEPGINN